SWVVRPVALLFLASGLASLQITVGLRSTSRTPADDSRQLDDNHRTAQAPLATRRLRDAEVMHGPGSLQVAVAIDSLLRVVQPDEPDIGLSGYRALAERAVRIKEDRLG